MIEEEYISLDTAKLAKEKGFNVPVYTHYTKRGTVWHCENKEDFNKSADVCSRPTQSLLARWLRGKYSKNVYVVMSITEKYIFWVQDIHSLVKVKTTDLYDTYEEAMEAGLQEALKLL